MNRAEPGGVAALLKDYRRYSGAQLWALLALMLVASLAEGLGILMLVPLATIAIGGAAAPGALGGLADFASGISAEQRFLTALALFVAAMAVRSALVYVRDLQLARLQTGYEASLRLRAAATLAGRGWGFASRMGQAGMQSLLLTDIPRASMAVTQAQQFAIALVLLVVQFALAAILSPELTLVALAVLAAGWLLSVRWTRRGVRSGMALVDRAEESTGSGFRLHAGLKAALAQGTVRQFLAEYGATLRRAEQDNVRFLRDLSATRALAFLGSAFTAALLLFVGYRLLALPFPVLVTSLVLFARVAGPAQQLQQSAQRIAGYAPSFAAIERRLGPLRPAGAPALAAEPLPWRELRLDAVTFEHQAGLGLRGASLTLPSGQWLGVGGPSGAGKTTLIDLVAGLIAPETGAITVDSKPLEGTLLDDWRAGLAYVGQDSSVFDDSVRGNLVADSGDAEDEILWVTLEKVGLADRIRAFPGGLDERVGDRGSALSGGERQRIAIARALLRRPSLLILDEATSALDAASEEAILQNLRNIEPRPAAIVVAHRPSTLAYCDSRMTIQHGHADGAAS
jgi:ATP-binding cassette subfamily C protein